MSNKSNETHNSNSELVKLPPEKIFHIKLEGYQTTGDLEFFNNLEKLLASKGFDTENLFYSAFDAEGVEHGVKRLEYIFGMNKAGWLEAIDKSTPTPPEIGDFYSTCIGVYDKAQLTEAYSYEVVEDPDPAISRINLINIEPGEKLREMDPQTIVDEAVVHNDPNASPTDALLAVVIID